MTFSVIHLVNQQIFLEPNVYQFSLNTNYIKIAITLVQVFLQKTNKTGGKHLKSNFQENFLTLRMMENLSICQERLNTHESSKVPMDGKTLPFQTSWPPSPGSTLCGRPIEWHPPPWTSSFLPAFTIRFIPGSEMPSPLPHHLSFLSFYLPFPMPLTCPEPMKPSQIPQLELTTSFSTLLQLSSQLVFTSCTPVT